MCHKKYFFPDKCLFMNVDIISTNHWFPNKHTYKNWFLTRLIVSIHALHMVFCYSGLPEVDLHILNLMTQG